MGVQEHSGGIAHRLRSGHRFLWEPRAARRVDPVALFLILVSYESGKRWVFPEEGERKVSRKKKSGSVLPLFHVVRYATKNSFMRFLPPMESLGRLGLGITGHDLIGYRSRYWRLHEYQLFTQKVP